MRKLLPLLVVLVPLAVRGSEWIELKDGTRVEGKILSVTAQGVLMDVQTSATIREEKNYPRAEVAKIQRAGKDDLAFAEVAEISVPATADDPAVYDALLEQKVRPFLKNYTYSKHMPEARKLAATLEAERARLAAGEVKVDGQWISASAAGPDKAELEGRIQLSKMKSAADPAASLMAFDTLEKNSGLSSSYPEAVKVARSSVEKLRTAVVRARADLERRTREQEQGLQLASLDRKMQMEAGIAQEKASIAAQVARSRQTGAKWLPLLPDQQVLDELSRLADSEETRLAKLDDASMASAVAAVAEAKRQIDAGQLAEAKASLERAEKLWPPYALLAPAKESLKKAEADAKELAAKSEPLATPTPTPAPTPVSQSWRLNHDVRVAGAGTSRRLEWRPAAEGWREVRLEFIENGVRSEYTPPRGLVERVGDSLMGFFRGLVGASDNSAAGENWVAENIDAVAAGQASRRWLLTGQRGDSGSREPVSDPFSIVWEEGKLEASPETPAPARPPGATAVPGGRIITRAREAKIPCARTRRHSAQTQLISPRNRAIGAQRSAHCFNSALRAQAAPATP